MESVGFARHDHAACVAECVRVADRVCSDRNLHLTPVRRRVLEILLEEHRALGAYDILDKLRDEGLGSQPPVSYRALDFLVKNGFAHRIELLNAFIACTHPGQRHAPAFLICRSCGSVAEARSQASQGRLADAADDAGFRIERSVIEAEGQCPNCQADAGP